MNKDNVFANFYQKEVDDYNFEVRKDSSHIPVNYAKLILANHGIDEINFQYFTQGRMFYWGELANGNEVEIKVMFNTMDSYQRGYAPDDIEIIDKYTIITEFKNKKNKSFLFDNPKKGIKGVAVDKWSKKYLVI